MGPEDFADALRLTAERYGMDLGSPLALVSGGPDSVALLRALVELGGEPAVLHVDHGLRGEESREDAEFVRALCERLGVRCEVRRLSLEDGPNVQERAREARYRLAKEAADELGLRTIAAGHTADDVAETLLMNLARGAGLRGLSGIPPVRGRLVRPMIERTRREVLDYLAALGQPYRTDPTNLTGKYARNRVRLEAMPVLEELHPGAARNLARAAALAREDLEALEGLAAEVVERRGSEAVLPAKRLTALPPALRRYAVRRAYAELLPEAPPLSSALVEAVLDLGSGSEGTRTLDLPGGVVAAGRGGEEISLYPGEEPAGEEERLEGGETVFAGWRIPAREVSRYDPEDASRQEVAYLDASRGPYGVRLAREGDIIRPLGLGGTKKVLRAMMDRKVPRDVRRRTPVVVGAGGEVAWIFLGELGEGFRVEEASKRMLRLEVARVS
ncbi:MAG TPA: tRNA lysidine(34) synthetase TilS [Rubrobacteraceae bacterium]|nr:tRNA lysidine(34) synthetase TilS [Rubrobacteraceae bacterium]